MSVTEEDLDKANKKLNNMKKLLEKFNNKIDKVENDAEFKRLKKKWENDNSDSPFDGDFINYILYYEYVYNVGGFLTIRKQNLEYEIEQQVARCEELKKKVDNNKDDKDLDSAAENFVCVMLGAALILTIIVNIIRGY